MRKRSHRDRALVANAPVVGEIMKLKNYSERDEMRPEYDFDYSTGVRGKYYRRLFEEGANE